MPDTQHLHHIAGLAAHLFDADTALVAQAVDQEFQVRALWTAHNAERATAAPPLLEFCALTVEAGAPLVVPDVQADARLQSLPAVTEALGFRSCAGVPLRTAAGTVEGAIGVFHAQPVPVSGMRVRQLEHLAALALHAASRDAPKALPRRAKAAHQLQAEVLERVVRGAPLSSILADIARAIEAHTPGVVGSIMIYDPDANSMRVGAGPHLPEAYADAIDGLKVGPQVGACGAAMHHGHAVVTADIATDPHWAGYRDVALAHNLRACWSVPIRGANDAVLGTFALYHHAPSRPSDAAWERLRSFESLASVVIERHRALQALRKREEHLSVTLRSIGEGVVATDAAGTITEMNAVAEALTGWARGDALGTPLSTVFHIQNGHTGDVVDSPVGQVLREGTTVEPANGTVLTARDGTTRPIAYSAAPIHSDTGDPLGVVLVFRDITEQHEREEALRRSRKALENERQQLAMALAGGDLGLWDWDMNTGTVRYNTRWANMLGYEPSELTPDVSAFMSMLHPDDRSRVRETIDRHARGEIPCIDLEIRMRHKDGSWRWVLDRGKILEWNADATPRRMVGTHMDITERKRSVLHLREAKEAAEAARTAAEQANRLKSIFLANMSHEIRTPLTSIIGFAETIGAEIDSAPPEAIARFAGLIAKSGAALLDTLNSVLNLSKLEAGAMETVPALVNLSVLIHDVGSSFEPKASAKGLDLKIEPDGSVLGWADPGGVQIVLQNLISNAIKFTPASGTVWVRTRQTREAAVLEVGDTGIGIDSDRVEELFHPFRQASEGVDRQFEGTGLGLAVTRRLVEQMEGRIDVDTEKGSGTTFVISLPQPGGTTASSRAS